MFGRKPPAVKPSPKGGTAFEVDETLGPLGRALLFGRSKHALQRLVFVHELVECAYHVGYDAAVAQLLPLVRKLASDSEVTVRQALAGQFGDLAGFLIQSDPESGYEHVVGDLLPAISTLLAEKAPDVRQGAADALVTLASHLRVGEREHHVLMAAIVLSQSNDDENARITAAQLLSGLAETLGMDLCQMFVGIELVALCDDPAFRVREATASGLAEISRVVGDRYALERLIPAFGKLVSDAHWGVRQAAAESLVALAMSLSVDKRKDAFVPLMSALLRDSRSRSVKTSAQQQLGYFIASLEHRDRVPGFLVSHYVEIVEHNKANPDAADLRYHCAYTFAAVVQAMGADSWASLQAAFASLCRDGQQKTRKAMAASIHVVARVLGCEGVEASVLPHFEALLQDFTDDVCSMALCSLAGVLRFVPSLDAKRRLLTLLQAGLSRGKAWRMRHLIASQMSAVCETMSSAQHADKPDSPDGLRDLVWSIVLPLFLQLCNDDSAEVRNEAARVTALLLRVLAPDVFAEHAARGTVDGSSGCTAELEPLPPAISRLVKHLVRSFARGKNFRSRQCYVRMCDAIIRESPPHTFADLFLRPLSRLATDPVPNVRLAWVNMLLPHLRKDGRLWQSRTLAMAASRMATSDSDAEIRRLLSSVKLGESQGDETGQAFEGGTGDSSECSDAGPSDDDEGAPDVWETLSPSSSASRRDRGDATAESPLDASATSSVEGEGGLLANPARPGAAIPRALSISSGGDAEPEETDAPAPRSSSRAQDSPPSSPPGSPPGSPPNATPASAEREPTCEHRGGDAPDVEKVPEDGVACPAERAVNEETILAPAINALHKDVRPELFDATEAAHEDDGLGSLSDLEASTTATGSEWGGQHSGILVRKEDGIDNPNPDFEVQPHSSPFLSSDAATTPNSPQGAAADSVALASGCLSEAEATLAASMRVPSEPTETPLPCEL